MLCFLVIHDYRLTDFWSSAEASKEAQLYNTSKISL